MDIKKEREAFEAWLFREYPDAIDFMIVYRPDENIYEHRPTQVRWEAWQAAKAQAVPEGFVLVEKNLIKTLHEELLDHEADSFVVNRDICELWKQAND